MTQQPIPFNDGEAYERAMGPWSQLVGDVRPDAGVRAQISANTAIVDQSAMRHPSSRRVTVAERPG